MATVKINQFGGIAPRQHSALLADGMATVAHNCILKSGKLVPLRKPSQSAANIYLEGGLTTQGNAKSLHVWRDNSGGFDILAFPAQTWAARGNIADDDHTRIIVSGDRDGDGEAEEPVIYARRGSSVDVMTIVKDAPPKPSVSRKAGEMPETDTTALRRYTAFFYTWVDRYGYESPCSEPSDEIEYYDGDTIVFAPMGTNYFPRGAEKIRIYKVVAGTEEGRIQYIDERTAFALDYGRLGAEVKVKDESAGEVMPEIEAPPRDLTCIREVPGAFYCGFSPSKPKTICFSDVNLLYSWPIVYRYDIGDNAVALAVTSNTVFALTDGWPYILSGTAPESMTVAKLAGPAACVSPRGVCVYRNAVYYASNEGLMTIYNDANAGTVCQNLTAAIFTKDQWTALNPASCVLWQYDGALFMSFTLSGGAKYGLTVSLMDNAAIAVSTHGVAVECVAMDDATDKAYFVGKEA